MLAYVIIVLWLAACAAVAWQLRARRPIARFPEQLYYTIALALFAAAPITSWLVERFTPIDHYWAGSGQLVGVLVMAGFGYQCERQRRNGGDHGSMQTFREKSALLMFAALAVLTAGAGAIIALTGTEAAIGTVVSSILLLIVISIAGHIGIALMHDPLDEINAPADERDAEVELRSIRNAYYVFAAGIWTIPIMAIAGLPGIHVALACGVLILAAELVYYGSLVRYYRAGYA